MPIFIASQAERWIREYVVEAETIAAAKEKFTEFAANGYHDDGDGDIWAKDPQYLEECEIAKGVPDVEWYDWNHSPVIDEENE